MKKERERQEALTEVWEERTDGVGNKFWVNLATRDTLLEHPVARAKRNAMHKAERARMQQPVRAQCGPDVCSSCAVHMRGSDTHMLTRRLALLTAARGPTGLGAPDSRGGASRPSWRDRGGHEVGCATAGVRELERPQPQEADGEEPHAA